MEIPLLALHTYRLTLATTGSLQTRTIGAVRYIDAEKISIQTASDSNLKIEHKQT